MSEESKKLILGFTGTQEGMSRKQRNELVEHLKRWKNEYEFLEIHHGDCIGADAEFHHFCELVWPKKRLQVVIHPPEIETKRAFCENKTQDVLPAKAYLDRNKDIVECSEGMIAAPKNNTEEKRSGTWSTVRFARKQNVPVMIMNPF